MRVFKTYANIKTGEIIDETNKRNALRYFNVYETTKRQSVKLYAIKIIRDL